jgi:hypothetical protein
MEDFETTLVTPFFAEGVLTLPPLNIPDTSLPSPHDSVRVIRLTSESSILYLSSDCIPSNPLCEESYFIDQVIGRNQDGDITTNRHLYTIE